MTEQSEGFRVELLLHRRGREEESHLLIAVCEVCETALGAERDMIRLSASVVNVAVVRDGQYICLWFESLEKSALM